MDKDYSGATSIAPRTAYSRHATSSSSSSNTRVLKMVTEMGSHSISGLSPALSAGAATALLESREKEKKDMQDLNDRLAGYIEKVRFLEAQNRKLGEDLDKLRGRWGKDTSSIKTLYEKELADARKLIDDTSRDKNQLESQIHRLQQDVTDYRSKYNEFKDSKDDDKDKVESLTNQLTDAEAEISLLRRRIQNLDDDINRVKAENNRVLNELQKTRHDLDQETLNRIDYQNQVQTLLEEVDFLNRVHDQEVKDLQNLVIKDPTREYREYFKDDLAAAIRDIRLEYDNLSQQNKVDMESWYKLKVQEIQTSSNRHIIEGSYQREETKRLRGQLSDLRGKLGDLETRNSVLEKQSNELTYQLEDDQRQYEAALNERDIQIRKMRDDCQSLMVELQSLLDTKRTLDAEIAIYRKMLEGEENRDGLKQLVDQMMKAHTVRQREDEGDGDSGDGYGGYRHEAKKDSTVKSSSREISYYRKTNDRGEVEESFTESPAPGHQEPPLEPSYPHEKADRPFHPDLSGSFSRPSQVKKRESLEPSGRTSRQTSIREEPHDEEVEERQPSGPSSPTSVDDSHGHSKKPSHDFSGTVVTPEFQGITGRVITPQTSVEEEKKVIFEPKVEEYVKQQDVGKYGHVKPHQPTSGDSKIPHSTTSTTYKPKQPSITESKTIPKSQGSVEVPSLRHQGEGHVKEIVGPKVATTGHDTKGAVPKYSEGHSTAPKHYEEPEVQTGSKYGHIRPQLPGSGEIIGRQPEKPSTVTRSRPQSTVEVEARRPSMDPAGAAIVVSPLYHERSGLGEGLAQEKGKVPYTHGEPSMIVKHTATTTASKPDGRPEESMHVVKGEMATRTSFQRSAKGNVSIAECHPEGKYIVLENTHRNKDEHLEGWKLKRNVDNKVNLEYEFPPGVVLKAGHSMKIWARNQGGRHNPPESYIFDAADSWGTGANAQTMLFNRDVEERATHVQRSSQQSTAST